MKELSDIEIIGAFQSGEARPQELAFRQVYRSYYGLIESLVVENSGNKTAAKDLFQDGLIALFNNCKKPDFVLSSTLKTYLYSICYKRWLMKLRKAKRETSLETRHEYIPVDDDQLSNLVLTEKKELIIGLLNELGKECKEILELFYYRKMRMEQIRQCLNLASEQVAKNKKSRCLKGIRKRVMENAFYQEELRR